MVVCRWCRPLERWCARNQCVWVWRDDEGDCKREILPLPVARSPPASEETRLQTWGLNEKESYKVLSVHSVVLPVLLLNLLWFSGWTVRATTQCNLEVAELSFTVLRKNLYLKVNGWKLLTSYQLPFVPIFPLIVCLICTNPSEGPYFPCTPREVQGAVNENSTKNTFNSLRKINLLWYIQKHEHAKPG